MAIGNVIGSNLFNIFFVLGCSASITPLHLSGITNFDLFTPGRFQHSALAVRAVLCQADHYTDRRKHYDTFAM